MNPGDLFQRITLQRLDSAALTWANLDTAPVMWAAVQPQGSEQYRIRIRWRADLVSTGNLVPAMRCLWEGRTLSIDDVVEVDPGREVHLSAHQVIVERDNLEAGVKERQTWP